MRGESLKRLVTISKGSTTQLASTKNNSAIDVTSIGGSKVIKKVGDSDKKFDEVNIVHANNIIVSTLAKPKDLI